MITSVGSNCLALTGSQNITLLIVLIAVLSIGAALAVLRARANRKRAMSAMLLIATLALGGVLGLSMPVSSAQAATGGNVCETPAPAQTPLTIVFVGQQYLATQVPIDGEVQLQVPVPDLTLREDVTICEDAQALTNCVTFNQNDVVNTAKTLMLSGANKKLNFSAQSWRDFLLFNSTPLDPFVRRDTSDVVVYPATLTSNSYSNGSTIYFSVMVVPS